MVVVGLAVMRRLRVGVLVLSVVRLRVGVRCCGGFDFVNSRIRAMRVPEFALDCCAGLLCLCNVARGLVKNSKFPE